MDKLKVFLTVHKQSFPFSGEKRKMTVILIVLLLLIVAGGFITFQKFTSSGGVAEEIDISFDPEGAYALLLPRRDGNALILNLKRTASYDEISYELAYTSLPDTTTVSGIKVTDEEGSVSGSIDRGVSGTIDTKDKKGEYEQEILFGTCSKNVCKYDKGVENGTLTLKIKKGGKAFRMIIQWHLQKPDLALGNLNSGDTHFNYVMENNRVNLTSVGYSIINDLSGLPKLPEGKKVLGKVYALYIPLARSLPEGKYSLELSETPSSKAKLARFDEVQNKWIEMETKIEGSKLIAPANGAGIFAVLINEK